MRYHKAQNIYLFQILGCQRKRLARKFGEDKAVCLFARVDWALMALRMTRKFGKVFTASSLRSHFARMRGNMTYETLDALLDEGTRRYERRNALRRAKRLTKSANVISIFRNVKKAA